MKSIILAAGYATRLYPLTKNKPKALLPICNKPILNYIVDEIESIQEINEILIVSNDKFYNDFVFWANSNNSTVPIKIINDNTTNDQNKLGAIGDINLVLKKENINEDVLIIAGDNFFTFKLKDFYNFYTNVDKDCILVKEMKDQNQLKRMGIAELDLNNKVIGMEEKPKNPKTNIAVYAAYIYKKDTLKLIEKYLNEGNNPDAPGFFPSWLYDKKDVYAYKFKGECYDIGTHESYKQVNEIICKNK